MILYLIDEIKGKKARKKESGKTRHYCVFLKRTNCFNQPSRAVTGIFSILRTFFIFVFDGSQRFLKTR
jgi:hypothetical protein